MYSSLTSNFLTEKQYLVNSFIYFWQEINPVSLWLKNKINTKYLRELQEVLFLGNTQSKEFSPKFFASLKELRHKFNDSTNRILLEYINTLKASQEKLLIYSEQDINNYFEQLSKPIVLTCLQVIFDQELKENTAIPVGSLYKLTSNILKLESLKKIFELNNSNICPVPWERLSTYRLLPQDFSTKSIMFASDSLKEFTQEYITNIKTNIQDNTLETEPSLNSINNIFNSTKDLVLEDINRLEKNNYSEIIKLPNSQPQDTELLSQVSLIANKDRTSWFKTLLNRFTKKLSKVS